MKKFIMMLAITVASCLLTTQASAESYRMRYVHGNSASVNPLSAQRAKTGQERTIVFPSWETVGKFSVDWKSPDSGSFDPAVKATVKKAMQKWSERLETSKQIRITVYYEPMASDLFTECYVTYEKQADNSCKPSALVWSQAVGTRPSTGEDAEIVINSEVLWDYSQEDEPIQRGMNLETMILRCIAQTLGFGTTLIYDDGGIMPGQNRKFTNLCGDNVFGPYEKLIFEKYGKRYIDYDVTSSEFSDFVQPDQLDYRYILYSDDAHKLYAPDNFIETESLGMLKNPNSLMWYQMEAGDRFFDIDDVTAEILREIGWTITAKSTLNVRMYEGTSTWGFYSTVGVGSAYKQYTVVFSNQGVGTISNGQIKLNLFEKDGSRTAVAINSGSTILPGSKLTFSLEDLVEHLVRTNINNQRYRISKDGDLEAEILFRYTINNETKTKTFRLGLEARPILTSITRKNGFKKGDYFTATFSLEGNHLKDAVCEISHPQGFVTIQQPGREPVYNATTGDVEYYQYQLINLHATKKSQIKIYAINEYGRTDKTLNWTFDPTDPTYEPDFTSQPIDTRTTYHCIYDIAGNIVFSGNDVEYESARRKLAPGYYFIKHISTDGTITNEKIKITNQ